MVDYVPDDQKEIVLPDGSKVHLVKEPGQSTAQPAARLTYGGGSGRFRTIKVDPEGLAHATAYLSQAADRLRRAHGLIQGVQIQAGDFAEAVAFEGALTQVSGPVGDNVIQLSVVCGDVGSACTAYRAASSNDEARRQAAIKDWTTAMGRFNKGLPNQKEVKTLKPQTAPANPVTKPSAGSTGGQPASGSGDGSGDPEDNSADGLETGLS